MSLINLSCLWFFEAHWTWHEQLSLNCWVDHLSSKLLCWSLSPYSILLETSCFFGCSWSLCSYKDIWIWNVYLFHTAQPDFSCNHASAESISQILSRLSMVPEFNEAPCQALSSGLSSWRQSLHMSCCEPYLHSLFVIDPVGLSIFATFPDNVRIS